MKIYQFRIFLWLILLIIIGWLFYQVIVPSGKIDYVYDFNKNSRFVGKLTPQSRVIMNDRPHIIGDPVYFSLFTPRKFDKAKLILKYKQEPSIHLIEAGVLVDKIVWRYALQPINNEIINKLAENWDVTEENGLILLQRNKKFDNIKNFLNNLPDKNEIAVYNYDLWVEGIGLRQTEEVNCENPIPVLNGSYQFYTYIDKNLDFDFNFINVDENKKESAVDLFLYYNNKIIYTECLDINKTKKYLLNLENLSEGVYKIEVKSSDNIITEKIITSHNLSFINKIWISAGNNFVAMNPLNVYTDSKIIMAQTIYPDSLQVIKINNQDLDINETYKQFNFLTNTASTTEIILQKLNIILSGDGVFSFCKKTLINPAFKKVDANLDEEKINYILARYNILEQTYNDWRVVEAEFDLTQAYRENGKYNFIISIPGLRADDEIDDWVEIDEIRLELERKTFLNSIFNF